jgi:hypothetical protein
MQAQLKMFCLVPKRKAKISFFAFVFFYKILLRRDLVRNPRSSSEEEEEKSYKMQAQLKMFCLVPKRKAKISFFAFVFFYKSLLRRDLVRNPCSSSSEEEEEQKSPFLHLFFSIKVCYGEISSGIRAAAAARRRRSKFPNPDRGQKSSILDGEKACLK